MSRNCAVCKSLVSKDYCVVTAKDEIICFHCLRESGYVLKKDDKNELVRRGYIQ